MSRTLSNLTLFTMGYIYVTTKQRQQDVEKEERENRREDREVAREQREMRAVERATEREEREFERAICEKETQQLERNKQARERAQERRAVNKDFRERDQVRRAALLRYFDEEGDILYDVNKPTNFPYPDPTDPYFIATTPTADADKGIHRSKLLNRVRHDVDTFKDIIDPASEKKQPVVSMSQIYPTDENRYYSSVSSNGSPGPAPSGDVPRPPASTVTAGDVVQQHDLELNAAVASGHYGPTLPRPQN